jgi:hypothetical protein
VSPALCVIPSEAEGPRIFLDASRPTPNHGSTALGSFNQICSPTDGGTCVPEIPGCGIPAASTILPGNPPRECYANLFDAVRQVCLEVCLSTSCGDGGFGPCGQVLGCMTNADCPAETIGDTGLPNKCVTASCDTNGRFLCQWTEINCPPGDACDPMYGCYAPTPPTP